MNGMDMLNGLEKNGYIKKIEKTYIVTQKGCLFLDTILHLYIELELIEG